MMEARVRLASRMIMLGGLGLVLVGCDSIREAAGITKEPPDEFAVVTKAPLVIPPDFNLRPPKPGASPTNQVSPTAAAQSALYPSDDPTSAAIAGNFSDEEKVLIAKAGGADADHGIREQITADSKQMEASDESFTDKVLFGGPSPDMGKPVDANAEAQRIGDAKAEGKPIATPNAQPTESAGQSQNDTSSNNAQNQKDSGGWFGGIFDIF